MPRCIGVGLWLCAILVAAGEALAQGDRREVAVTFDDLPAVSVVDRTRARAQATVRDLLDALRRHGVRTTGFVNEQKLYERGALDSARLALLADWIREGHELGNHTYSHRDLHTTPVAQYQADILRGERHTRALAARLGAPFRYFRHPMLHTGRSLDIQARMAEFLRTHRYLVAPVTIDNYDYIYSAAYERVLAARDTALARAVRAEYVTYMDTIVGFYEQQAKLIVGRLFPQILLLHANPLNAAAFGDLAAMLRRRGYEFVELERALRDSAYMARDTYVGPAGITWLHRWALTARMRSSIYVGEPEVPDHIRRLAEGGPAR
jgi:peptidoglycan/xylan/chitin deacetylase (PgdA/CDA1 family)